MLRARRRDHDKMHKVPLSLLTACLFFGGLVTDPDIQDALANSARAVLPRRHHTLKWNGELRSTTSIMKATVASAYDKLAGALPERNRNVDASSIGGEASASQHRGERSRTDWPSELTMEDWPSEIKQLRHYRSSNDCVSVKDEGKLPSLRTFAHWIQSDAHHQLASTFTALWQHATAAQSAHLICAGSAEVLWHQTFQRTVYRQMDPIVSFLRGSGVRHHGIPAAGAAAQHSAQPEGVGRVRRPAEDPAVLLADDTPDVATLTEAWESRLFFPYLPLFIPWTALSVPSASSTKGDRQPADTIAESLQDVIATQPSLRFLTIVDGCSGSLPALLSAPSLRQVLERTLVLAYCPTTHSTHAIQATAVRGASKALPLYIELQGPALHGCMDGERPAEGKAAHAPQENKNAIMQLLHAWLVSPEAHPHISCAALQEQ